MSPDTSNLKLEDIFIWSQRISHKSKTSLWWNNECSWFPGSLISQNDFLFSSLLNIFPIFLDRAEWWWQTQLACTVLAARPIAYGAEPSRIPRPHASPWDMRAPDWSSVGPEVGCRIKWVQCCLLRGPPWALHTERLLTPVPRSAVTCFNSYLLPSPRDMFLCVSWTSFSTRIWCP